MRCIGKKEIASNANLPTIHAYNRSCMLDYHVHVECGIRGIKKVEKVEYNV